MMPHAALGVVFAAALVLAGCLGSEPPSGAGPEPTGPFVYSWSTHRAIGLDGGARIAIHPPATECDIRVSIAGWTSDPGISAVWLSLPADGAWVYSAEGAPYMRSGAHDTNAWRDALHAGGVALDGGGNMTTGEVVYVLAKNLTSWRAINGQVFPALVVEARCDAPGLNVTFARNVLFLHERNMDDGTVIGPGSLPVFYEPIEVARGAASERELNGSVAMYAMGPPQQNNIQGTLTIEGPDTRHFWEIGPSTFYEHGPPGHYRAIVDRLAASMASCTEPGEPCGPGTPWWGFIAGFEETDDPDAFFGLSGG